MADLVEHADLWFQGRMSSPDSKLFVLEGDDFRNRIVAKFERAADAAAAVEAHNATVSREAEPGCDCFACRNKRNRVEMLARLQKAVA